MKDFTKKHYLIGSLNGVSLVVYEFIIHPREEPLALNDYGLIIGAPVIGVLLLVIVTVAISILFTLGIVDESLTSRLKESHKIDSDTLTALTIRVSSNAACFVLSAYTLYELHGLIT